MFGVNSFYVVFVSFFIILLVISFQMCMCFETFAMASRDMCPTRNQSYDIRGDPLSIPRTEWPLNNSTIGAVDSSLCPMRSLQ